MKGSPMQRNYGIGSPIKQTYDKNDTDTRVYNIDQNKYDAWAKGKKDAPDIRHLGSKENNKWIEQYLKFKKSKVKPVEKQKKGTTKTEVIDPEGRETGTETKKTTTVK